MEIPDSQNLLLPLLKLMGTQDEYRISEMVDLLARQMAVEVTHTGEQDDDHISRDQKALFYSRVVGARSLLVTAKLIENPKREISKITERGLSLLEEEPLEISFDTLAQYPEFQSYLDRNPTVQLDPELVEETLVNNQQDGDQVDKTDIEEIEEEEVVKNRNPFSEFSWDSPTTNGEHNGRGHKEEEEKEISLNDIPSLGDELMQTSALEEENGSIYQELPPPRSEVATPINPGGSNTRTINAKRKRRINSMQNEIDYYEETAPFEDKVRRNHTPTSNRRMISPAVEEKVSPIILFLLGAGRFIEIFFKNKWLYLMPVVILLAGWVASLFLLEDQFTSKGILYVQSDTLIQQVSGSTTSDFGVWVTPAQETKEELDELINTNSFIRLIIQQTELEEFMDDGVGAVDETIGDVYDSLSVNYVGLNNVIVESTWNDRGIAVDLATATLNSFINWKITQDKKDSQAALEFLEELVPQYEQDFQAAVNDIEAFYVQNPEPFRGERPELEQLQIDILNQKLQAADTRLQDASNNLEQVRLEQVIIEGKTRQTYSIIDAPRIPIEPNGGILETAINFVVFFVVGVIIMLLAVAISALVDQTIKFPREVSIQLDSDVLTVIHKEPQARKSLFRRNR